MTELRTSTDWATSAQHAPPIDGAFRPHPLVRGGHAQTIVSNLWWHRDARYQARQHYVALGDGDKIVLHDDCPQDWRSGGRVVLLIHGLGGCHQSGYMERMAHKLPSAGIRAIRMDLRGCGAGAPLASRTVHAGRSADVNAAAWFVHRMCPQARITACGFSLGAGILLKLLGEHGGARRTELPPQLDSAIAVSPPIDLATCVQTLKHLQNWGYDWFFARLLWRRFRAQRSRLADLSRARLDRRPRSLFEFDDRITAPLGGFSSALEYYRQVSAKPLLAHIQVPTQILVAADDPLIPLSMFERVELPAAVRLMISPRGGHLGFLGRPANRPRPGGNQGPRQHDRRWMEWRIVEWVRGLDAGDSWVG